MDFDPFCTQSFNDFKCGDPSPHHDSVAGFACPLKDTVRILEVIQLDNALQVNARETGIDCQRSGGKGE